MAGSPSATRWPEVTVEEDRPLRDALWARARDAVRTVPVSVTDLLDPRPAYYRRVAPVPLPAERARLRAEGAEHHRRWAARVGGPDAVEIRVEEAGVVGVIDVLEPEGPTELKTTDRSIAVERLREDRPAYVDQLGLYCALLNRPEGHLVVVGGEGPGTERPVAALACRFHELPGLREEAARRAERLRRAYRSGSPEELPRCRWFGPRCPFREASACACTGAEARDADWVQRHLVGADPDPRAAARWRAAITAAEAEPAPVLRGFGDLLWPRRAFFERRHPEQAGEARSFDPERSEEYRALVDAVEGGPPEDRGRRPVPGGDPPLSVTTFRGEPALVKVHGGSPPPSPVARDRLPDHYWADLGLRAAALQTDGGWVFVSYPKAGDRPERWRALRLRLVDRARWKEALDGGRARLAEALRSGDPSRLDPCPAWMVEGCPYRARCGCGPAPAP